MTDTLWGGRFQAQVADWVQAYGASIDFDQELAAEDIAGSQAHVQMLVQQGILSETEGRAILSGLTELAEEIEAGQVTFSQQQEDIHLNLESLLTAKIGPVAGKMHTARSRNDQVATDLHLWLKKRLPLLLEAITNLQAVLLQLADEQQATLMPGLTHLQHAQPISFGHHLLAYFEMLQRDYERFAFNQQHTDMLPLGAAALAGTTFPIDRQQVADTLGFDQLYHNSLDAVSDRDFVVEFLSNASLLMMHLSRFAEELILWTSQEFGYLTLSDTYATGSSIMPQKKNADFAELTRGKTGRVYGHLQALLTVLKGLPLAYNKDMQEDKEGAFDTMTTVMTALQVMAGMLASATVHQDVMLAATKGDYSNATELADYLAKKDLPFRQAHAVVGHLVYQGLASGRQLEAFSLAELQAADERIEADVYQVLQPTTAVNQRQSLGGTATANVAQEVQRGLALLAARAK
ncbi:argininosuccinate lyase [Leuconostocaceae bacterium ESL0958]|nr:argininosuccinate lyase [Leuconostocaceae bacterium ESL0958]